MAVKENPDKTEKTRKLAEFKTLLEKKIAETETELESLKVLLEHVDKALLERGFKRADITKIKPAKAPVLPPVLEYETVIPLKSFAGDLLANLYISRDSMRVTIAEDKNLNVKTPPFQQFLVERVLGKMREKDSEAASKGEITPDNIFSYELILEGDILKEIVVRNVTADRLRELKSSIHWTLEKMHEKAERPSYVGRSK